MRVVPSGEAFKAMDRGSSPVRTTSCDDSGATSTRAAPAAAVEIATYRTPSIIALPAVSEGRITNATLPSLCAALCAAIALWSVEALIASVSSVLAANQPLADGA